jgi:hypothetical protein
MPEQLIEGLQQLPARGRCASATDSERQLVQKPVHQRPAEQVETADLVVVKVRRAGDHALELAAADLVGAPPQLSQQRIGLEARAPRLEAPRLGSYDLPRPRQLPPTLVEVGGGDSLNVVDVTEDHTSQLACGRFDVARDRKVDHHQRPVAVLRGGGEGAARDHGIGSPGRADEQVTATKFVGERAERDSATPDAARQALAPLPSALEIPHLNIH